MFEAVCRHARLKLISRNDLLSCFHKQEGSLYNVLIAILWFRRPGLHLFQDVTVELRLCWFCYVVILRLQEHRAESRSREQ